MQTDEINKILAEFEEFWLQNEVITGSTVSLTMDKAKEFLRSALSRIRSQVEADGAKRERERVIREIKIALEMATLNDTKTTYKEVEAVERKTKEFVKILNATLRAGMEEGK